MQSTATMPLTASQPAARPGAARRLLWASFWLVVLTVVVGRAWDGYWHITHLFDGFWAPPHVFVYAMSTFAGLFVAALCFVPSLRRGFGPGLAVPGLPFALPGGLFLLASGFVALGVAGMVVDNAWHTAFGLNETPWSLPHNMIGASLCVITLGFTACRLALRGDKPLRWPVALLLGVLLLSATKFFLGPLYDNATPEGVRAVSNIPVLAAQPAAQAGYRVVLAWNLTRSNPALIVLGAVWAGIALTLLHKLDERPHVLLLIVLLWAWLDLGGEQRGAAWLGQFLPVSDAVRAQRAPTLLMPLAMPFALLTLQVGRWRRGAWAAAGLLFGALVAALGGAGVAWLLVPLAAPAMLAGARVGEWAFQTMECPTAADVWGLVLGAALGLPLIAGGVDLWLRTHTM